LPESGPSAAPNLPLVVNAVSPPCVGVLLSPRAPRTLHRTSSPAAAGAPGRDNGAGPGAPDLNNGAGRGAPLLGSPLPPGDPLNYAAVVVGGEPRGAPTAKRAAIQAAILDATEAILAEGTPYPELNIERIARRAGISRTAFYFYFRDKRELLMRLTEDVTQQLYAESDIWFSGEGEPVEDLARALRNVASLYHAHGDVLRAIVDAASADEEVARFWHAIIDRFIDATRQRVEQERAAGRSGVGEPRATAFALCWMTERTFHQQFVLTEPVPPEELLAALTGIWARTIYGA
jgi:AcrR family transcriptional regulator